MSVVWLNGALLDASVARIDPTDRGFTLGDGIFETIRAVGGVPAHVARHFARMHNGAAVLGIPVPFGDDALFNGLCSVLRENALPDAVMRLTLTRGPAARGVLPSADIRPTVLISASSLPSPLAAAKVVVAERVRRNEFSPLAAIKSLNYLDNIFAKQEAAARGVDDALLLNTQGFVAEASAANIFVRLGQEWVTPPVSDGALPGIMRSILLERFPAHEKRIVPDELYQADAAFLTNSLGYRSISQINAVSINIIPNVTALKIEGLI